MRVLDRCHEAFNTAVMASNVVALFSDDVTCSQASKLLVTICSISASPGAHARGRRKQKGGFSNVSSLKSERARMPSLSFIVARSYPGNVIGDNNRLPWHLKTDLKRFREITTGHVVIMGRATHLSIGRTLPNRTNIVLTRDPSRPNNNEINFDSDAQLLFINTFEEALFTADVISICREKKDIFVIGGQTMYELFGEFVNRVYLTEIFAEIEGDAFFKMNFSTRQWRTVEEIDVSRKEGIDDYNYRFSIKNRIDRKSRDKFVSEFLTEIQKRNDWLKNKVKHDRSKLNKYVQDNLVLEV